MLFLRGDRVAAAFSAIIEPLFQDLSTLTSSFVLSWRKFILGTIAAIASTPSVFSEGHDKVRTSLTYVKLFCLQLEMRN